MLRLDSNFKTANVIYLKVITWIKYHNVSYKLMLNLFLVNVATE